MNLHPRPGSPAISVVSVPSLRRLSISTNGSFRTPHTPNLKAVPLQPHQAKGMSHTSSKTWISPEKIDLENWQRVRAALRRFGLNESYTPFLPWTDRTEWSRQQLASKQIQIRREQRRLASLEELRDRSPSHVLPFAGKDLRAKHWVNRGAVLSLETVWCMSSVFKFYRPIWPGHEEMSYEGDQRIAPGAREDRRLYRRQLPLVRNWTVDKINSIWSEIELVKQSQFDNLQKPLASEDIHFKQEPIPQDDLRHLLGDHLLAVLEEDDYSLDDEKDQKQGINF